MAAEWRTCIGRVLSDFDAPNPVERICLGASLGGLAVAVAVTLAQMALPAMASTPDDLHGLLRQDGPAGATCPDGWAGRAAAQVGLTEAEVTAWYLREALTLPDATVIAGVGVALSRGSEPPDDGGIRARILLCIAQSRRLIPATLG